MGVENNEAVLATVKDLDDTVNKIRKWIYRLPDKEQDLFAIVPAPWGNKTTFVVAPDGSKKGPQWKDYQIGDVVRQKFIDFLETLKYSDGSSPVSYVEVGYGEYGQKVLRGNCKNCYSDKEYEA